MSDPKKMWYSNSGKEGGVWGKGDYRVKCHGLTECRSSSLPEKGQLAGFQDEYRSKVLIKIQGAGI